MTGDGRATEPGAAGLLRTSSVMAVGTVLSRATGLLRTAVLAAALGVGLVPDAYWVANTLPNIVYELLLGGVLTATVVPLVVRAARDDGDDGVAFAQKLLTAVALLLGAAVVLLVLAAPWLMRLYLGPQTPDEQLEVATAFARFFLPQILFYGIGATLGAILNTRGHFAAPMWTPILNNLVVIATGIAFVVVSDGSLAGGLTTGETVLLGAGTTAGIVLQTVALWPAVRAVGFRWRPRLDLRNSGLGRAVRLGGWMFLYVAVNQLGLWVVIRLATSATRATLGDAGEAVGYSIYTYAFLLFSLPHAIVAVSIISALLPQMSRHAADDRLRDMSADLARGTRLAAVVLVPATFAFLALHEPVAAVTLGHGRAAPVVEEIGITTAIFALGLVPFSAYQLQLRGFYALADTRTPAVVAVVVNAVNVGAALAAYHLLPAHLVVYGLAGAYAASYTAGWAVSTRILGPRVGGLGTARTVQTLVRLALASLPAAGLAAGLAWALRAALGAGFLGSLAAVVVGGAAGAALFGAVALRLRIREVHELLDVVRRRVRS